MSSQVFSRQKLVQLLIGGCGIYFCYLVSALMQQRLIKKPYINIQTQQQQYFKYPIFFMIFPHGFTYISGLIYNYFQLSQQQRVIIPNKNSASCAFLALLGGITFNYAILYTNYPIVVTVKSCNLLSVILVGALCSRVKDIKVKLSTKKILIGVIASFGIVLFTYFDPEKKNQDQKNTQIIGFIVLFVSLLADGFLPDFQAEIKTQYKPKPTQMMVQINKWVTIFSLIYCIVFGQVMDGIKFMFTHKWFFIHLTALGLLNCFGQFFVYRMIKQFKQHIVPFVITTRKIFTVAISILFYNHPTSPGQICGVLLVFAAVIYQFVSQMYQKKQQNNTQIQVESPSKFQELEERELSDQTMENNRA